MTGETPFDKFIQRLPSRQRYILRQNLFDDQKESLKNSTEHYYEKEYQEILESLAAAHLGKLLSDSEINGQTRSLIRDYYLEGLNREGLSQKYGFRVKEIDAIIKRSPVLFNEKQMIHYLKKLEPSLFHDYFAHMKKLIAGHAYDQGRPVFQIFFDRFKTTLSITIGALLLSSLIAGTFVWIQIKYPLFGVTTNAFYLFSICPVFILGYIIYLAVWKTAGVSPLTKLYPAIIALALGDGLIFDTGRVIKDTVTTVTNRHYIKAIRARGLNEKKHLARSLILPLAVILQTRFMFLLGGVVVAENVFEIPGMGNWLVEAVKGEGEKINVIILFTAVCVILSQLTAGLNRLIMHFSEPQLENI